MAYRIWTVRASYAQAKNEQDAIVALPSKPPVFCSRGLAVTWNHMNIDIFVEMCVWDLNGVIEQ
jgi:hypothetical protein